MLILGRQAGQRVMIGDDVSVTVLGIKGSQVRLAIEAPSDKAIYREELLSEINLEQPGRFSPPQRKPTHLDISE